ncbi:hypothetical protein HN865_00325 [Candidatus Woesearchaeota archaeon]|jgi:hypothetical protein|nr:hypothetical protein [Candidatus Woesearchaeota archaeon]MBT7237286.1 hypothetical protein [Candidatus Woesearchaeota archaeon]
MGNQILTNKTLYHIVTSNEAAEIEKTGFITPVEPMAYMSINQYGYFDFSSAANLIGKSDEEKRNSYIVGRSDMPNIFFSDSLEVQMPLRGTAENLTHVYTFTVRDILKQALQVFKNPSDEFPTLYNVPCRDGKGLKVADRKIGVMHAPETITELLKRGTL